MTSARTNIREIVAEVREDPFIASDSALVHNDSSSPKGRDTPIPETPGDMNIQPKPVKNMQTVLDFVSRLTAMSCKTPNGALEDLLEDLGFVKEGFEDDESEGSSFSSSSFSFNFEGVSGSLGISSAFNTKSLKNNLARFSSELAHRCWIENNRTLFGQEQKELFLSKKARKERQEETEQTVVPWNTKGAVLFIDLSGYSKIASFLTASGGAHALSEAVNAYFEAILSVVVAQYGGDIITFAGDAVVACFSTTETRSESDCTLLACACALDLQRKCGMSPVQGTDLAFRLHIGITFGELLSQVLKSKSTEVMQNAYHFVSGHPLTQTAIVVDRAKVGEICITGDVQVLGKTFLQTQKLDEEPDGVKIYKLTGIDDDYEEELNSRKLAAHPIQRSPWIETNLVPSIVAKKLRQGFKPAHIAEMRFLCVLFIRKQLNSVNTEEWFSEVQIILDQSRCPIVQMLHDDKGTHLIAAVNLYHTERNPASVGVLAARRLVERETGCAIGMACGETFCGITGSDQSCRWDITGPQVVRACRLMQHAVSLGIPAVFDDSIYGNALDVSELEELPEKVSLKGSPEPILVYTLSETSITVTSGIMDLGWGGVTHITTRQALAAQFLQAPYRKGVALVSGPVGAGKRTMICATVQEVGGFSFLVHYSTRDVRELTVLRTVFDWFCRHVDEELRDLATRGSKLLQATKLTQTLNVAHQLVNKIIEKGHKVVLCVAYSQFLDTASIRFIKSITTSEVLKGAEGKFLFVLTAYALYGVPTPNDIAEDLQRGLSENIRRAGDSHNGETQVKLVHLRLNFAATGAEFKPMVEGVSYFKIRDRAADVLLEATGGCLHLVPPLLEHLRSMFLEVIQDNGSPTKDLGSTGPRHTGADLIHFPLPATSDGTIHITPAGEDYLMQQIYWPQVAPTAASRFTELYDALSPRLQLVVRVIASLSTTTGSANRYHAFRVMAKLNSKVTEERTNNDIDQLISLQILKPVEIDGGEVTFAVPAMVDVVSGLFTPDQDKALKRHAHTLAYAYYTSEDAKLIEPEHRPIFTSFQARLARAAGQLELYKKLLAQSWLDTLALGDSFPEVRSRMEERLASEFRRHPKLASAELYKDAPQKPLLVRLKTKEVEELEKLEVMYPAMEFAKGYMPTFALGPISGEMQKLVWAGINNLLDFTKRPKDIFLDPEVRKYLYVDPEAYGKALETFEQAVPKLPADFVYPEALGCPKPGDCKLMDEMMKKVCSHEGMTIAEEKALVARVQKQPANAKEAEEFVLLIRAYHFCVQMRRRERIVRHVRSLTGCQMSTKMICPTMKDSKDDPVRRAFYRFVRPYPIPQTVIHEALLDLATAGWRSKYYSVNLQYIRDEILKKRTSTLDDFKAFLLCLKMFGEEITTFTGPRV